MIAITRKPAYSVALDIGPRYDAAVGHRREPASSERKTCIDELHGWREYVLRRRRSRVAARDREKEAPGAESAKSLLHL